jgi:hypothetical protein
MHALALLALLVTALLALYVSASRARELCVLSVRDGRLLMMRGALPPSLLEAIRDIVHRTGAPRGTIRLVRDGDRARVDAQGLEETVVQRVRNVVGTYPMPRLLAGAQASPPNLGKRLGIAWLAWRMHERERVSRD